MITHALLNQIEQVSSLYPDLRLGQLLICAAIKSGWQDNDIFNVKDVQLFKGLTKLKVEALNKINNKGFLNVT